MASTRQTSKEVVRRGFETLNDRDRDAFVDLHSEDAVLHAFGEVYRGAEAIADNQFGFVEAFPDLELTPETIVAEGDTVTARWTVAGTHEAEFQGLEPTGESVEFPAMGTFRIEDERIAEVWLVADQLVLMQQLGVVEPIA